jgi:hypothetical protein
MHEVPWLDDAVVVKVCPRRGKDSATREVVVSGPLWRVVNSVQRDRGKMVDDLVISCPDRGAKPYQYVGREIVTLMLHSARPR